MIAQRILALALLSCVLVACGGGGGGNNGGTGATGNPPPTTPPGGGSPNNPPTPPPDPVDWEQHSAENARMGMISTGSLLTINWTDLFDNELGFQVERRIGPGSWEVVESLPAMNGGVGYWQRTVPVAASYRVTVTLPGKSIPLHSPGNETEIAIDPAPSNPITIQIDQTEPVRGAVQISLQNAGPAAGVTYTLNGAMIARVTGGGTFAATLPTQHLVDGQRELYAFIEKTPGLTLGSKRMLQVDNPVPAVLLTFVTTHLGGLTLSARASSDAGITSVEFFVNGTSMHVAHAPVPTTDQYAYSVDLSALPPGTNVFRVVATDSTTANVSMERTYEMDAAPTLNVTGLFDGMIASANNIGITGEFSDDVAGANVAIYAGALRLLQTQSSPFAVDFASAGVPPGEHSVIVRVQDSFGKITARYYRVVVPSTSLNYELLANDAGQLLAADGGSLLYRKTSGAVVLRNSAGLETVFPRAPFDSVAYRMSEGRIMTYDYSRNVHVLDSLGQATNISQMPGITAFNPANPPGVRGPWVSWRQSAPTLLRLHDLRTGTGRDVPIATTLSGSQHDIVTTAGNEQLLLQTTVNGTAGIYSQNLATDAMQLLVSGSVGAPRTDGTRFIWLETTNLETGLYIAPLSNPAAATLLSTNVRAHAIEGGLACWIDFHGALLVNDGAVTTQLTPSFGTALGEYTIEDGRVIFPEDDQMHVWSAAGGERVWLDAVATEAIHADGVAYFLTGSSGALYRVTLP